jgi:hypothetical protein
LRTAGPAGRLSPALSSQLAWARPWSANLRDHWPPPRR